MNKRLIWIFSAFAVVAIIIIISCVAFTIGDISVQTATDTQLTEEQKSQIIIDSGIVPRSSIFGINKEIATANIEKNNPSLKVISIVRKEPNKVFINVATRIAIMSIAMDNGKFANVDRDLKVVNISEQIPTEISVVDGIILPNSLAEGEFLPATLAWLKEFAYSALDLSFLDKRFSYFIDKISFDNSITTSNVKINTNSGVIMVLSSTDIGLLFNSAYNYYHNFLSDVQKSKGYIILNDQAWEWKDKL